MTTPWVGHNQHHDVNDNTIVVDEEQPQPLRRPGREALFAEAVVMAEEDGTNVAAKKRRMKRLTHLILLVSIAIFTIATVVWATTRRNKRVSPVTATTLTPTMAPTGAALAELADELSPYVANVADLTKSGTPQNAALHWLAMNDAPYRDAQPWNDADQRQERTRQRFVLAVVYFSLNGDGWQSCNRHDPSCSATAGTIHSWLTATDECTWNWIRCDDYGRVTGWVTAVDVSQRIDSERDLRGTVPPELALLTSMQTINIRTKPVQGPILSYLSSMANLTVVRLHDCLFEGPIPTDFATRHPALTELDLSGNALSGPIHANLDEMSALKVLDLNDNAFAGSIPSTIGAMPALMRLDLGMNNLTGNIPLEVYNLSNLSVLSLGNNKLGGSIPSEIGNLSNLTEVSLGPSIMTGPLPAALFNLTKLEILQLHDSQFTGPLREEDFVQIADTITLLRLENNDFTGPIPIDAWEMVTVLGRLQVFGNPNLNGTITQTLCDKRGIHEPDLQELKVGCNIRCAPGCCADTLCDSVWAESKSELPP
jgi:hypothetical protein